MLGSDNSYRQVFTNRSGNLDKFKHLHSFLQNISLNIPQIDQETTGPDYIATKLSLLDLFQSNSNTEQNNRIDNSEKETWFEIGFGTGDHLYEQIVRNPNIRMIGCDPFTRGVLQLCGKISNHAKEEQDANSLAVMKNKTILGTYQAKSENDLVKRATHNLRIFSGAAGELMDHLEDDIFERIFVLFPDPWPKRKQNKRRIFSENFLNDMHRLMKRNGIFRIASDNAQYIQEVAELLISDNKAHNRWSDFDIISYKPEWPKTKYQQKATEPCLAIEIHKL